MVMITLCTGEMWWVKTLTSAVNIRCAEPVYFVVEKYSKQKNALPCKKKSSKKTLKLIAVHNPSKTCFLVTVAKVRMKVRVCFLL